MKFAEVSYSSKKEDFDIKGILLKLPNSIVDWYLFRYRPFYIEKYQLAEAEGYKIKIYQPYEQQTEKQKKQIENILFMLQQKEVAILLTNGNIELPHMIDIASGNVINALFVLEAAKKALKRQSKTLQQSKFVIIDGGDVIIDLVLEVLYPYVNYISIYTNREQYFLEKAEEIYEECGLRIEFFYGTKNKLFDTFDIVVNCSHNIDNYDYKLQKNAFFFDVVKNKQKMQQLMARRKDLLLSDGLLLKWENHTYFSKQLEVILYITEQYFYNILKNRFQKQNVKQAMDLIQNKKIAVTGFTCFEKRV